MDRESFRPDTGIGPGIFVAVVGPSGAGKDTIMRIAQMLVAEQPRIRFPKRLVTRVPSVHENNYYIDSDEFTTLVSSGNFALAWSAHGLSYAVPASVDDEIRIGALVVVNISRNAVAAARQRYRNMRCVYIDAPPDARLARLSNRGREHPDEVRRRIDRAVDGYGHEAADFILVNDGTPEDGASRFAAYCESLLLDFASA